MDEETFDFIVGIVTLIVPGLILSIIMFYYCLWRRRKLNMLECLDKEKHQDEVETEKTLDLESKVPDVRRRLSSFIEIEQ